MTEERQASDSTDFLNLPRATELQALDQQMATRSAITASFPSYLYIVTDERSHTTKTFIKPGSYADFLKNKFSVIYFNKMLYIYDDEQHIYHQQTNEIESHIRDTFERFEVTGKLQSILLEIKTHLTAMGCYYEYPFNRSIDEIPVENGIVKIDYSTGEIILLPHAASHLFTYKLSIVYNPTIKNCEAIFLLQRMVETPIIKTLIQIPAQALLQMQTGHAYKKAYLLQGEAHAGKTSYLKLLYALFGDEFTTAISLQQLCDDRFVGGSLEGKLLNIYDDLEDVALAVVDQFKTLTGDCRHGIERKYEGKYTGRVTAVHIFTCNYPPEYPEKIRRDAAFWARWEYLKFPFAYPVNPNFYTEWYTPERLSSFFNLILAMMIHIRKKGLISNSEVQDVMMNWNINSDPLYDFIAEYFEHNNSKNINHYSKVKLHALYLKWCEENDIPTHKQRSTLRAFTIALQSHQFIPSQKRERKNAYETYATVQHVVKYNNPVDLDYKTSINLQTNPE